MSSYDGSLLWILCLAHPSVTLKYPARSDPTWTNPQVDPPSKYHATSSKKLDHCILKVFDLKPENR